MIKIKTEKCRYKLKSTSKYLILNTYRYFLIFSQVLKIRRYFYSRFTRLDESNHCAYTINNDSEKKMKCWRMLMFYRVHWLNGAL